MTTDALLPPKAKELEMTTSGAALRAHSGTMSRPVREACPRLLTVGGRTPSWMALIEHTASMAPAAPRV